VALLRGSASSPSFKRLLDEVAADPTGIFWGYCISNAPNRPLARAARRSKYITLEVEEGDRMRNEFTAVVERHGRWLIAYCPEIPGANGQGKTKAQALKSLRDAIALILEDRRKDGLRGVPATATREKVVVG
jgi:predicted RNase H-like HicB family nuclease